MQSVEMEAKQDGCLNLFLQPLLWNRDFAGSHKRFIVNMSIQDTRLTSMNHTNAALI